MSGDYDPIYVRARSVLLDALSALHEQRDAIVLVGAQGIYLHAGEADFAVAEYTEDADLVIDRSLLKDEPRLAAAMSAGGFSPHPNEPGIWLGHGEVPVDLIVPDALAGPGRRGARLGVHGNRAARRAVGLEAAIVDRAPRTIQALDPADSRSFDVNVAGPAALLIAKMHKLGERSGVPHRLNDKDALDVFRVLRALRPEDLAPGFRASLADAQARAVTQAALEYLRKMFASAEAEGASMVTRALPMEDSAVIAASCAALSSDLLQFLHVEGTG